MSEIIKIENLTKKYPSVIAVDNISFSISKGSFFSIIGQNGAGKSTTIKMIVGELLPDLGDIFFNGKILKRGDISIKKRIFYIPQTPIYYPYLTGEEYIKFIANIYGVTNYEKKLLKLFKLLDFEKDKKRLLLEYSQGMIKKTVLTAALISEAELLIFDEVFAGLDPVAIYNIKNLIVDQLKDGKTVIFASHILDSVEKLCSDIVIMKKGKIVETLNKKDLNEIFNSGNSLESYYIKKIG